MKKKNKLPAGVVKVPTGTKFCWISKEDKNGWSLGFALNSKTLWIRGLRLASRKEVERAMEKSSLVFVNLKSNHSNK